MLEVRLMNLSSKPRIAVAGTLGETGRYGHNVYIRLQIELAPDPDHGADGALAELSTYNRSAMLWLSTPAGSRLLKGLASARRISEVVAAVVAAFGEEATADLRNW